MKKASKPRKLKKDELKKVNGKPVEEETEETETAGENA